MSLPGPKATSITRNAFDWTVGQAVLPHDRHRRVLYFIYL